MPSVTRELSITYGGFTVGGTEDDYLLDGQVTLNKSFETAFVEFTVLVKGDTEAAFAANVAAIEAAFRDPFNNLTVTQGSETIFELSHSGSTGFNTQPSIDKAEDDANTGRSRRYSIRIDADMPADNVTVTGHRESTVNVAYSPARRRTVTISGVWTAHSASAAARAAYEAGIAGFAAGILSSLGGTFELAEEPTTEHDTENKLLSFTQVYDELIFSQPAALDDPAIVRQQFRLSRQINFPGDSIALQRPDTATVSYECWVDKDVTTDLVDKWENSIRGFVLDEATTLLNAEAVAVLSESPEYFFDDNRISATMEILGVFGNLLSYTQTVEVVEETGLVLAGVWSGDHLAKYTYQGIGGCQRTTTINARVRTTPSTNPCGGFDSLAGLGGNISGSLPGTGSFVAGTQGGFGFSFNFPGGGGGPSFTVGFNATPGVGFRQPGQGGGGAGGAGGGVSQPSGYRLISKTSGRTPLTLGSAPDTIDVEDITFVTVEQWANDPSGGFIPTT